MFKKSLALRGLVAALTGVLLLAVSSCGSDSSGGDGVVASSSNVEEATAIVEKAMQHPTSVGITKPIGVDIPTGKRIAFVSCGIAVCETNAKAFKEAADVLGWTVDVINAGLTPQSVNSAWESMVRTPPDGVVTSGYPRALFAKSLKKLEDLGVPVVDYGVDDVEGDGIDFLMYGPEDYPVVGALMADWVIHSTKGKANTLWVGDTDYPVLNQIFKGFETEYKRLCADCKIKSINTPTTAIGTTLPTTIANELRANTDINYVALGIDTMGTGLPEALKSAGIDVPFMGENLDALNQQYIVDGKQDASVSFPINEAMWTLADALARIFTNQPYKDVLPGVGPTMIFTKDNLQNPGQVQTIVEDYQQQFKTLWGK
jgi:ribose transport system substrate-binding protein